MKKKYLAIAVLLLTVQISAQNFGEINGSIISQENKEPVLFATVRLTNDVVTYNVQTDVKGKFDFSPVQPGEYNLKITTLEFSDLIMSDIVVIADQTTFLNNLELANNMLPVINITWEPPLVIRDNPSLIAIYEVDLKRNASSKSPMGIVAQLPGINSGNDGQELYFRGSRPQSISTFIDGVRIIGNSFANVPSNAIKSLNVYTGGVPASYGDITGGVIILETKSYMDFYRKRNN
ncbi:MAG: hypothetical protein ACI8XB_000328 [Patiriisocius sp.]|jgi:hypothetical protein